MTLAYSNLFSPMRLKNLELKNRVVMAPMSTSLGGVNGEVTPANIAFYRERALGGFGLIIVEFTCVDPETGRTETHQLSLDSKRNLNGHVRLVETLHRAGAKVFVQLQHGGRFAPARLIASGIPKGPSAVVSRKDPTKILAEAMSDAEIEYLIAAFGRTAALAAAAGYDGIEIHGAHGYLLSQFLSAFSNQRDDRWGGDLQRRMAFPLAVLRNVRAAAKDLVISFRLSADEFLPNGVTIEESLEFSRRLADCGADIIHVSTGRGPESFDKVMEPMSTPEGWRIPFASRIRQAAGIPVIAVGQIRWPETAEAAIAGGDADLIALGRPSLADPAWPAKAQAGKRNKIRPCTSCNWCISGANGGRVGCAENPRAGAELDAPIPSNLGAGRRALVVGAGPGGMAAALMLDQAGFETEVFDKRSETGGGLVVSAAPPGKEKLNWYADYLRRQLRESRVKLHLGTELTAADAVALRPAVSMVATGTTTRALEIDRQGSMKVLEAFDVLMGDVTPELPAGTKILVYGGGETGCESAEYFAHRGYKIVLITRSAMGELARSAEMVYRIGLLQRLRSNPQIEIRTHSTLRTVLDNGAVVVKADGGEEFVEAGLILLAQGRNPAGGLAASLLKAGLSCHVIGDADRVGRIGDAVHAAYQAIRSIAAQDEVGFALTC